MSPLLALFLHCCTRYTILCCFLDVLPLLELRATVEARIRLCRKVTLAAKITCTKRILAILSIQHLYETYSLIEPYCDYFNECLMLPMDIFWYGR